MKRESNLELCRIISMMIIILNHIVSLSGVIDRETFTGNTVISLIFLLGGKFGTNVFVILGLYFLVDQKKFNAKKIARIWLQTLFYCVVLNILDVVVFSDKISWQMWVRSFLPVLGRCYWFASSYIILLAIIPLLSRLYEKLEIKWGHIWIGIIVFSIFPTVTFNGNLFGNSLAVKMFFKILMFGPVWFSFLYFVIRFLKENFKFGGVLRYIIIFVSTYGIMLAVEILMYTKGINGNGFMLNNYSSIRDMSSFFCLVAAGSFFIIFKNLKIKYSKQINFVASTTFGVYLLHTHAVSAFFWRDLFNLNIISKTNWYVPYSLFLTALIFAVGIAVECLRKKLEHVIFDNDKSEKFFYKINQFLNDKLEMKRSG